MDRNLLKYFWNCGDNETIQHALDRAHLTTPEKAIIGFLLDDCITQEQAAEKLDISVRKAQEIWYAASGKILSIPWVYAYAKYLKNI